MKKSHRRVLALVWSLINCGVLAFIWRRASRCVLARWFCLRLFALLNNHCTSNCCYIRKTANKWFSDRLSWHIEPTSCKLGARGLRFAIISKDSHSSILIELFAIFCHSGIMSARGNSSRKVCCFCNLTENNELEYGKFHEHNGIVAHYYCLVGLKC